MYSLSRLCVKVTFRKTLVSLAPMQGVCDLSVQLLLPVAKGTQEVLMAFVPAYAKHKSYN